MDVNSAQKENSQASQRRRFVSRAMGKRLLNPTQEGAAQLSGEALAQTLPPAQKKWRRACIFSFYDEQGIVDDYVVFFLKELGKFAEHILFYSNGPITKESEAKLHDCVAEIIIRPNVGYDVMAYKEGLEKLSFGADGYDEIIMANHTCYGPVYPFAELFNEMANRECDFWGVSAHLEMTPNPINGSDVLHYHLNANFIAVRSAMLKSKSFQYYWGKLKPKLSYNDVILSHETVFTEIFVKLGYKVDTYIDCTKYGSVYPLVFNVDETMLDRNPLLKRRIFFHDAGYLESRGVNLPRALRILEDTSDYDQSLIWRNITRHAELRTLNTNAGLTSVLPDVRVKQGTPLPRFKKMAVCVHLYYTDMIDEILELTSTIPQPFDFIATTDTAEKKAIIEQAVSGYGNVQNVIVRVVEQNRGRDMSALFISCRDLFLDDTYELVCRLHTKKSLPNVANRGTLFKQHLFENLLNSQGYTENVMDMFHDHPWIGVAAPPLVNISYEAHGSAWINNRPRAEQVAKLLDIHVNFDPNTPIATYGSMFWFRPKALHKLFTYPWKWEDFETESDYGDGDLPHALERLICYVAQDARYTTQQIMSPQLAGWNYAMFEYKYQSLVAGSVRGSPTSVRVAFRGLVQAVKRSFIHRCPKVAWFLRPLYRKLTGRKLK